MPSAGLELHAAWFDTIMTQGCCTKDKPRGHALVGYNVALVLRVCHIVAELHTPHGNVSEEHVVQSQRKYIWVQFCRISFSWSTLL